MSEFKRILGFFDTVSLVIGIIIGSGIFLTTGEIAKYIQSPLWILVVWFAGGVISAWGAITFAQLGTLYPQAGGAYVYLRESFGGATAFVYGLALFIVLQCGSIAAIAIGFAHYFGEFCPCLAMNRVWIDGKVVHIAAGQLTAIVLIWLLTWFHYVGGRCGIRLQNVLTVLKVLALLIFIAASFLLYRRWEGCNLTGLRPSSVNFGIALIAVLWTFAGSHNVNYVAEEVHNPNRNIPMALLSSIGIISVIYIAVNAVYVFAVPISQIYGVEAVAAEVSGHLFGTWGRWAISAAIILSTAGAVNGLIFATPRVYFAMAKDGVFPGLTPELHPRYHTPSSFLLIQAIWTSILVLSGSYSSLFTFVMFSGFVFFALIGISLLKLRPRLPQIRLFWEWTYPIVPLLYIATFLALAVNTLRQFPIQSLAGIALLVLALPMYRILHSRHMG